MLRTNCNREDDEEGAESAECSKWKRKCTISTPEAFKNNGLLSSTPLLPSKAKKHLNFEQTVQTTKTLKFRNLPVPFMERLFVRMLDKTRSREKVAQDEKDVTVVKCSNYNRDENSVIVEFGTDNIAKGMSHVKYGTWMNSSIVSEQVPSVQENCDEDTDSNSDMYSECTVLGDDDDNDEKDKDYEPDTHDIHESDDDIENSGRGNYHDSNNNKSEVSSCELSGTQVAVNQNNVNGNDCKKILITNLPDEYDELYVKWYINTVILNDVKNTGINIISFHNQLQNSAVIEVKENAYNCILRHSNPVKLMGRHISFQPFEDLTVRNKMKVIVINLPKDYDEYYIRFYIERIMLSGVATLEKPIISFSEHLDIPNSAVIEFGEEACASCVLQSEPVKLQGSFISFKPFGENVSKALNKGKAPPSRYHEDEIYKPLHPESDLGDSMSGEDLLRSSSFVCVKPIPAEFSKKSLKEFLINKLVQGGMVSEPKSDDDIIVETIYDYNFKNQSVVVKFSCSEEASLATLLEDVYYFGTALSIVQCLEPKPGNSSEVQCAKSDNQIKSIDLDSKEGTIMFIQALIKFRNSFPHNGSHDIALNEVKRYLSSKGVICVLGRLRTKRSNLLNTFRKQERSETSTKTPQHIACSVAFNKSAELSLVSGTIYEPDGDSDSSSTCGSKQDILKFSKVAQWTIPATRCLISICLEEQEDFDKPIRRSGFWDMISGKMVDEKYFYSSAQCENKIEALKCLYKSYHEDLADTGSRGAAVLLQRSGLSDFMDLLDVLLENDVTTNAKVTAAAGVQHNVVVSEDQNPPRGKARPPVLTGRQRKEQEEKDRQERRTRALEKLAEELSLRRKS